MREAERKRQEARADIEAKKRVREQIEADKRERAERVAREKAAREGRLEQAMPAANPVPPTAAPSVTTSTSNEARLRVRCPNGTWQGTLPADTTLVELENRIQTDGQAEHGKPLNFTTTFPRKQLSEKLSTLRELGLVPNAALEASY